MAQRAQACAELGYALGEWQRPICHQAIEIVRKCLGQGGMTRRVRMEGDLPIASPLVRLRVAEAMPGERVTEVGDAQARARNGRDRLLDPRRNGAPPLGKDGEVCVGEGIIGRAKGGARVEASRARVSAEEERAGRARSSARRR